MRAGGTAWLAALGLGLALGACGSPQRASSSTEDLRLAVGTDPRDLGARLALASRASEEGRPGEALRELLFVAERRELEGQSAKLFSVLLLERGRARLTAGDAGAQAELVRAQRAGREVLEALLEEASALCVLASWRHSSKFRHARGTACLEKLPGAHLLGKQDSLEELTSEEALTLWKLWEGVSAKRQALKVAERYVAAGGREASRLEAWRALHQWWYGDRRPLLPVAAARMLPADEAPLERLSRQLRARLGPLTRASDLVGDWNLGEDAAAVSQILEDYGRSPARAERRARRWVDGSVYPLDRLAIVSELFYRLGNVEGARVWAQELADLAPELPAAQEAAGLAHFAAGQVERGALFITRAAAASGDAGGTWRRDAAALGYLEEPLRAIGAGKRAKALTAVGWDMGILWGVAEAQRALGRSGDAGQTLEALWSRFPLAERQDARERARAASEQAEALRNERGPGQVVSLLGPIRESLGLP